MFEGFKERRRQRKVRRDAYQALKDRLEHLKVLQIGIVRHWPCTYCQGEFVVLRAPRKVVPPSGAVDIDRYVWEDLAEACSYCGRCSCGAKDNRERYTQEMSLSKFLDDLEQQANPYTVVVRQVRELEEESRKLKLRQLEIVNELERQRQEKQRLELEAPQSYRDPPLLAGG